MLPAARIAAAALALLLVGLTPPAAVANPPAVDPQNSCGPVMTGISTKAVPMTPVPVLDSYIDFTGGGIAACSNWAFGSHDGPCPAPPFVGVSGDKFCGPIEPPGGTVACSFIPVPVSSVYAHLVIAFDADLDGRITVQPPGTKGAEMPFYWNGPAGTNSLTAPNPYGFPARAIAFPVDMVFGDPGGLPMPFPSLLGCA